MTDSERQIIEAVASKSRVIRSEIRKALLRRWLKESEAAIYLGCSSDEIGRMRKSGRLKAGLLGKQWRYHLEDLDKCVITGRQI